MHFWAIWPIIRKYGENRQKQMKLNAVFNGMGGNDEGRSSAGRERVRRHHEREK
jgi:hypothetical protein